MTPVILSGGSGTRLWPLSRGRYPIQFLPLVTQNTMLQETLLRLDGLSGLNNPIVVCSEDHRFMMAEQLMEISVKPQAILLEPVGKKSAAAIALAALAAESRDEVLLVLPPNHVINDKVAFHQAIESANSLAKQGNLVTFGILPSYAETDYGYIMRDSARQGEAYKVAAFVEKPDATTANKYLKSGDYLWNSGMLAFTAGSYLKELDKQNPAMLKICAQALHEAITDPDFTRIDQAIFSTCPADSIGYAILEKTDKAVVLPLEAGWKDISSWTSLWDISVKDIDGNAFSGDVMAVDTHNSFIYSDNKLVATVGLENLVVINTKDALMIAPKDRVQDVNAVVDALKRQDRSEAEEHCQIYRNWGHSDAVDKGERHQTNRIIIKPGGKLPLQKHHHRAEHWIVVRGTALVTRGEEQVLLGENEAMSIPLGMLHRLENPGVIPLEVIEIKSGSYLGDNDEICFDSPGERG